MTAMVATAAAATAATPTESRESVDALARVVALIRAIDMHDGRIPAIAAELGCHERTVHNWLTEYGLARCAAGLRASTGARGHGPSSRPSTEAIGLALLEHPTVAAAARALGVPERSLCRWYRAAGLHCTRG